MNNLNDFNNKGDYSWSEKRTRFQPGGFVRPVKPSERFWMKPTFQIPNDLVNGGLNMDKTPHRKKMIQFMRKPKHQKIYRERSYKVEPMQGLVKDIFELDRCWMRGDDNNRWLFAAMGLTVQMHQLQAFKQGRSTWKIKELVLG